MRGITTPLAWPSPHFGTNGVKKARICEEICEGVKQIRLDMVDKKNIFTFLKVLYLLHTFTELLFYFQKRQKMDVFSQKNAICEELRTIYLYSMLLLENLFHCHTNFVKVQKTVSSQSFTNSFDLHK